MTDETKTANEPPLDCLVMPDHACPNCGWRINDAAFLAARFDFDCPRCGGATLSEFNIDEDDKCSTLCHPDEPCMITENGRCLVKVHNKEITGG